MIKNEFQLQVFVTGNISKWKKMIILNKYEFEVVILF